MQQVSINSEHLWDRLVWASQTLDKVQSDYRIVFEDPLNPEESAKILTPDPNWMACALYGNILPEVGAYLEDQKVVNQYILDNGSMEGFDWNKQGGAKHPYADVVGPMTEEEAIEYLILKDIPSHIWSKQYNSPKIKIIKTNQLPKHREYRNSWRLINE